MKLLEKIFIALALVGFAIRVLMWEWGEMFLTVSLPSLAVMYLLTSWSIFKHKEDGQHLFLSVFTGLAFFFSIMGILMKLMVWRYANLILIIGLLMMLLFKVMGLVLERRLAQEMDRYFRTLFMRYYIIAGIAFLLLLTPYKAIVTIYHRDDPEYITLFTRFFEEPKNRKYKADFLRYRRQIFKEKLKKEGRSIDGHDHNHKNHEHEYE